MKKMYQTPEVENYEIKDFCQYEGQSESGGEVTPTGNEDHTFDANDMVQDVTVSSNLWDD